jgi:hypothetical protein
MSKHSTVHSGQLPPAMASVTEGVHARYRKSESFQSGMQAAVQYICLAQRVAAFRVKDQSTLVQLPSAEESPKDFQRFPPFGIGKNNPVGRCILARVENGHTVPSIETIEKIAQRKHRGTRAKLT